MKNLIIAAMLITPLATQAQLTHEHDYTGHAPMQVVKIENDGIKYVGVKYDYSEVTIYNTNHTVWKSIPLNLPMSISSVVSANFCSRLLFNSDNNIELLLTYNELIASNVVYTTLLINENGNVIDSLPNAFSAQVKDINGTWKLFATRIPTGGAYYTSVYSLPGQWTGAVNILAPGGGTGDAEIFPNPFQASATIQYSLPAGTHTGTIQVYNANGQVIRSYQVTDAFSNIILNRADLPAGVYLYSLSAGNTVSEAKRFVVQ